MRKILSLLVSGLILMAMTAPSGYQVGDVVADFKLKNVNGEMISMESYPDAEGFIVVFTCNTCPVAKLYEQRIIDLASKFNDQGYPLLAINPNDPVRKPGDSFDAMVTRSAEKDYPFPYLWDETQEVARDFGATATPHTFLLKKTEDGKAKVAYIGAIDDKTNAKTEAEVGVKYVEKAIKALKKGEKIETEQTRAIGCSIKWKQ
ncbi:MAG: thioredoxin family protein [Bacteroidota bacterium]